MLWVSCAIKTVPQSSLTFSPYTPVARKASDHTPKVVWFSSEPFIHPAAFINQLSYNHVARSPMLPPSSCLDLSRAIKQLFKFVIVILGRGRWSKNPMHPYKNPLLRPPSIHTDILGLATSLKSAMIFEKGYNVLSLIIMVLKIKITIPYINDIASPDILILPSLASSARIGSRSVSFIPVHLLSLLRSVLPPLLESIHKI